jgi:hypothetical protein
MADPNGANLRVLLDERVGQLSQGYQPGRIRREAYLLLRTKQDAAYFARSPFNATTTATISEEAAL